MWIGRALFEVHLVANVRNSFSPNLDGFSEESGRREKRKFAKKVSSKEEVYVKRTSQFYCPTPIEFTPEVSAPQCKDQIQLKVWSEDNLLKGFESFYENSGNDRKLETENSENRIFLRKKKKRAASNPLCLAPKQVIIQN